jgi:VWFA-related protein
MFRILLLLMGTVGAAQAQPLSPLRIHQALQGDPQVQIVLETLDTEGHPITGLTSEDIEIEVDGFRSRIESLKRFVDSGVGFGTVILIDTSNSMDRAINEVQQAARDYVDGMRGSDVAIIAQFKETIEGYNRDWNKDKSTLRDQIDRLKADGRETHLNEALNRVVDEINSRQTGPDLISILVLTDGLDYGSPAHLDLERATRLAKESGIPISTVHYIPKASMSDAQRQEGREVLENLAKDTRGIFAHAETASAITGRFQAIQSQIHSLWVADVAIESMPAGANPQLKVSWNGLARTTTLGVEAAWAGAEFEPEPVEEEPSEPPMALILGGIAALLVIGGFVLMNKKNQAARDADRAAAERVAQQAQDSANEAMDEAKKAQAQLVDAQTAAEAEKEAIAQAQSEQNAKEQEVAQQAAAQAAAPAAPRRTMFRTAGGAGNAELLLENGTTVSVMSGLGAATVRIGGDPDRVDVVLNHETVSGHHANFTRTDAGAIFLEDVGSSNGTYVNNQDIRGQGPVALQPGQAIQFGLLKTSFSA